MSTTPQWTGNPYLRGRPTAPDFDRQGAARPRRDVFPAAAEEPPVVDPQTTARRRWFTTPNSQGFGLALAVGVCLVVLLLLARPYLHTAFEPTDPAPAPTKPEPTSITLYP